MADPALQSAVRDLLTAHGPLLGKELCAKLPERPYLAVWQACFADLELQISHFATYYLRYDVTREDEVRLSPSVLRDFLSFTLIYLPGQRAMAIERQIRISNRHHEISQAKIGIARAILTGILDRFDFALQERFCAFLAGDNAYFLGHEEPREVKASGEIVRGSDIDIIIVHDGLDQATLDFIDREMITAKHYYLTHPDHHQEMDYICKTKARMFDQMRYRDINEKIASKIAYESLFLAGSVGLYSDITDQLDFSGAKAKIEADFAQASLQRKTTMQKLLSADPDKIDANTESLFFFSRERLEFQ